MNLTKSVLFIATVLTILPSFVRAADDLQIDAAEKEKAYQIVCVPGSEGEKSIPADKAQEFTQFRERFHHVLTNPQLELAESEKAFFSKDFGTVFSAGLDLALTCGLVRIMSEDINSRGCKDTAGASYDAKRATVYCADLEVRMNKARGK